MSSLLPLAVDRAAERDPGHDAVRFSGAGLDYEALSVRSGRLAHLLRERGVERGDRVGIYARKDLGSAVSIHGIMKAGAAYVPLDPLAPSARIRAIIEDCGLRHLVSEDARAEELRLLLGEGLELDSAIGVDPHELPGGLAVPWNEVEAAPVAGALPTLTEDDLAYVLYTSGSTGVPKGVTHTHRSALAFAEAAVDVYGFHAADRITNHAPLHFDLSTLDYFATAVAGATTVVIPEAHTKLPASFARLLEEEAVTVVYAVPLALAQLGRYGALERRDLGRVRWILFGGEPFPPKHLRSLMRQLPAARFSNVYGPTEVNGVTYWHVPPIAGDDDSPIPIGGAFPNVGLVVVGDDGKPASVGDVGELLVHSPTMMWGYWGRPDLDEGAISVRRDLRPAGRYHRTGDLVREDPEGVLHFLGRKDRQIKTRGYRVELDEVESVLNQHPDVETAAAYALPDGNGSSTIEAVVRLAPGATAGAEAILAHAGTLLPPYAVPLRLGLVAKLPRTSTGKIDRLRLVRDALARRTDPAGNAGREGP